MHIANLIILVQTLNLNSILIHSHLRPKLFSRVEAKRFGSTLDTPIGHAFRFNSTEDIIMDMDIPKIPRISKKLCAALIQYYEEFKTTDIEKDYVVPSVQSNDNQSRPKWLRGFELGQALSTYISKGNVGRISLGGNMPPFQIVEKLRSDKNSTRRSSNRPALSTPRKQKYDTYNFSTFLTAVSIYKSVHNDSLVIPKGWTVPRCDPWPESCWGMPLGVRHSSLLNLLFGDNNSRENLCTFF
jgi:hypothetical protein